MTKDLAAWLLEQIAEDGDRDRRVARLACAMYEAWQSGNPYTFEDQKDDVRSEYLDAAEVIVDDEMPGALAECDAKRRIIEAHKPNERWPNGGTDAQRGCQVCDTGFDSCGCVGWGEWPCDTLRLLALPYADHPGYLEDWRP